MSKEELKIGEVSKPRVEYRTFGQDFGAAHARMARLSVPVPEKVWERHSEEIYIMSKTNDLNNTKIRDGKMDIKTSQVYFLEHHFFYPFQYIQSATQPFCLHSIKHYIYNS